MEAKKIILQFLEWVENEKDASLCEQVLPRAPLYEKEIDLFVEEFVKNYDKGDN